MFTSVWRSLRQFFPSAERVIPVLSIAGLAFLAFVLGAVAMHYRLPAVEPLRKSFDGAAAWWERVANQGRAASDHPARSGRMQPVILADQATRTADGFTLYTTTRAARAILVDMQGNVVQEWAMPFSQVWRRPPHVARPFSDDLVHWVRCHLYPNGDLLAIYQAEGDTPYGYGLIKLDKDSRLLWTVADCAHHDLDVDEQGRVYVLTQRLVEKAPAGLESVATPYLTDDLVVLSPEGRELDRIPILEAFRDSPYALMLEAGADADKGDVLHTNSLKVLRPSQAAKFPLFRAGQVLLSVRNLSTLAVLDLKTRTIVWAASSLWRQQHAAEFLDNGRLLLFDNLGLPDGSHVCEYDPVTQAIAWTYPRAPTENAGSRFFAPVRGTSQRLANGNTLIVDPVRCRVFEVTAEQEIVWDCMHVVARFIGSGPPDSAWVIMTAATRYPPEALPFLKGVCKPRP